MANIVLLILFIYFHFQNVHRKGDSVSGGYVIYIIFRNVSKNYPLYEVRK